MQVVGYSKRSSYCVGRLKEVCFPPAAQYVMIRRRALCIGGVVVVLMLLAVARLLKEQAKETYYLSPTRGALRV